MPPVARTDLRILRPLLSWLNRHWNLPDGSERDRTRLIDIQVEPFSLPRPFDMLALLVTAFLVALAARPPLSNIQAWLWLVALAFNPTSKLILPLWMRRPSVKGAMRLRWLCLQAVVTAALFVGPMVWMFFHTQDTALRVFLVLIGAGVLSVETIHYNRLPPVVLCWVLTYLGIALQIGFGLPKPLGLFMVIAGILYVVTTLRGSFEASKDLMRRCAAEFEAERQTENLSLVLNDIEASSRDWFWECDPQGRLVRASSGMVQSLGRGQSIDRMPLADALARCIRPGNAAAGAAVTALSTRLCAGRPFRDVTIPLDIDDQARWWSISAKPLFDRREALTGWRGSAIDVSDTHLNEQALAHLAVTDALTGLHNRRGLHAWLDDRFGHSPPTASAPAALLLLNLDGFKAVNDAHGHPVGDRVLQAVTARLGHLKLPSGRWFRLGGDEFALAISHPAPAEFLLSWCERLLGRLAEPHDFDDLRLVVPASVGVAYAPTDACSAQDLLRAADMALYAAKGAGRNQVRRIDEDTRERTRCSARMTQDLARALDRGELRLVYQPLFNAATGQITGVEALLRWSHPVHGEVAPDVFIDLAERTGQIVPIGAWTLTQACLDAADWPSPVRVAVNLSARQLENPRLADQVRHALRASGLPAERLELEVTETALVGEIQAAAVLDDLRRLGVGLVLDDFGTGFSSLSYLQRLRFDALKIDRSFVHPLVPGPDGRQARTMLQAIVEMARALGMPCTAEGIETPHQQDVLSTIGCRSLQGYHLAPPMSVDKVRHALLTLNPAGLGAPALP